MKILAVNWVSSCLSFLLSAFTAATYIFTTATCTITIIILEPCAWNAYSDLINFHYFVDITEREDRGESRAKDADITDNSNMAKIRHPKKACWIEYC